MTDSSRSALRVGALIGVLFLFFVSLELMGDAFKLMGAEFVDALMAPTANPFVGLFMGMLATALVQSSSTTTSLTVALVASGSLSVTGAVPIIMGANIGTTVTNTIVSMGHITERDEFKRAMAGATVHDFFNLLAVFLLLPLEIAFGVISESAKVLTDGLTGVGGADLLSPLKVVTEPVASFIIGLLQESGVLVLIVGLGLLFLALRYLVVLLKALMLGRAREIMQEKLFGSALIAMASGAVLTFVVQSSSVATSLVVPLVGAGIITVRQVFPYTLGSNIGTTMTALLAALALSASGEPEAVAGLTVAFAHLLFNIYGILLVYLIAPLREIPIRLAEMLSALTLRNRFYAIAYLLSLFFLLPLALMALT